MARRVASSSYFNQEYTLDLLSDSNEYDNIQNGPNSSQSSFNEITAEEIMKFEIRNFKSFIRARVDYLKNLRNLNDNWIDGHSETPNETAINHAIDFLSNLYQTFSNSEQYFYTPKLIMSPMPIGGISIELSFKDFDLEINFHNNSDIEMQSCEDGKYYESSTNSVLQIAPLIIEGLRKSNLIYGDTQQGNPLSVY